MEGHYKAWRAHRALYWLSALGLLALGAYVHFSPQAVPMDRVFLTGSALALLFVFNLIAARGARLRRPWARLTSLLSGFVLLLVFPIGTLFGLYLIGASWNPWPEPHTHAGAPSGAWPSHAVRDRPRVGGGR